MPSLEPTTSEYGTSNFIPPSTHFLGPIFTHPMITRIEDETRKPKIFLTIRHPISPLHVAFITSFSLQKPNSCKQAALDTKWVAAMKAEIQTLHINQTWIVVTSQPDMM